MMPAGHGAFVWSALHGRMLVIELFDELEEALSEHPSYEYSQQVDGAWCVPLEGYEELGSLRLVELSIDDLQFYRWSMLAPVGFG